MARTLFRLVVVTLMFITVCGRLAAQGAAASFVSYLTGRDKATQLHLLNLTTGEDQVLNLGVEPLESYEWSPDGQKLVLSDRHDIYVVNPDGTGLEQLTHSTDQTHYDSPVWSPDGSQIALLEWTENSGRLAVIDSDGSNFRRVMGQPDIVRGALLWSPDGQYIAVNSVSSVMTESFVVDAKACLQAPDDCLKSSVTLMGYVSDWSPDGRLIMLSGGGKFSSSLSIDEIALKLADPKCRQQPHAPCATGISLDVNTHWPTNAVNTVYPYDSDGHWSHDKQQILFVSNRMGGGEIYVIDANGAHLRQLTHAQDAYSPRWRPA